jgi:hypothetical protein
MRRMGLVTKVGAPFAGAPPRLWDLSMTGAAGASGLSFSSIITAAALIGRSATS